MTTRAMQSFTNVAEHPYLTVPQHVIWDAVISLARDGKKLAALRLIRGAYFTPEAGWASLTDALAIYSLVSEASNTDDIPKLIAAFEDQTQEAHSA